MAGLADFLVTGQNLRLRTATAIPTVPVAAAAPTKAEYDGLVAQFNALVVALRGNGMIV